MDEMFKEIRKPVRLTDVVVLGSYEEADGLDLASVTKKDADKGTALDGLILRGYETKFADGTNTNGERYTKDCFDKFAEEYFVKNGLNMPLTIQHHDDIEHLAGRVIALEVNSVGFYFVCYIPKTYKHYAEVYNLVKEGILQGLSKEGWCTKGKWHWNDAEQTYDYMQVEELLMSAVSLVATPANGNALEKAQEVRDALNYENKNANNNAPEDDLDAMFN